MRVEWAAHAVLLVFAWMAFCAGPAWGKRPVTLGDLLLLDGGDRPSSLDITADGHEAAIQHRGRVVVLDARTGKAIMSFEGALLPAWSPREKRLAFYSRASGDLQLWTWTLGTKEPEQLTTIVGGIEPDPSGPVVSHVDDRLQYSWSPDGFRIVFASLASSPVEGNGRAPDAPNGVSPLVLTNNTPPSWTLFNVFAHGDQDFAAVGPKDTPAARKVASVSQLFVVELGTKRITQLTRGERGMFQPSWSPNGRLIACAKFANEKEEHPEGEIVTIDVLTGEQRVLSHKKYVQIQPQWSWDGRTIAYFSSSDAFHRFLPIVEVRDSETGSVVGSTETFARRILRFSWSRRPGELLLMYSDGVYVRLGRFGLRSENVEEITPRSEVPFAVQGWAQTTDGSIALAYSDPGSLSRLWLLQEGSSRPRPIANLDEEANELDLGGVSVVHWRNNAGDAMEGAVLFPPDFNPRRRYPLIVDAYPLKGGSAWLDPMSGNQAWASNGYVVFRPGPRAPHAWVSGFKAIDVALGGKGPKGWQVTVDDVNSGVDELVRRGFVDEKRMCLYGFSNGGSVVTHLVTQTHRFRCAIVMAPALADWVRPALMRTRAAYLEMYSGGLKLGDGVSQYVELSPVFRLASASTPMLIAAGDEDGDFLLDAIEVYNGVRKTGTEVTFVRYPGQGHLLSGAALKDFWKRQMAFFHKYLLTSD